MKADGLVNSPTLAHRAGHFIGVTIRRYLSCESIMKSWFVGKGMNPALCKWLFRILKLGLTGLALYLSFWIALVFAGIWILRGMAELGLIPDEPEEQKNGLRGGHAGFGYYCGEYRVDGARLDSEDE